MAQYLKMLGASDVELTTREIMKGYTPPVKKTRRKSTNPRKPRKDKGIKRGPRAQTIRGYPKGTVFKRTGRKRRSDYGTKKKSPFEKYPQRLQTAARTMLSMALKGKKRSKEDKQYFMREYWEILRGKYDESTLNSMGL